MIVALLLAAFANDAPTPGGGETIFKLTGGTWTRIAGGGGAIGVK